MTELTQPGEPFSLENRVMIELACRKSIDFRKKALKLAKDNPKWFINAFVFTYDPRKEAKPHHLPFLLYDFQEDFLDWLEEQYQNQEDGLVEKSRDMGATWVYLAWVLHKWLFDDGFQCLLGSRKEDLVSNGTLNSLFGRFEYMLRRLPTWMLPNDAKRGIYFDFDDNIHKLKIVNPLNKNTIEGESSNAQFSRQGRYSIIIMDEGAFWEHLDSAWRASGDASPCRIIVSTPNWQDWKFQELRFDTEISIHTLLWDMHPKKDSEWLEKERKRKSAIDFEQELQINYRPHTEGIVYPQWGQTESDDLEYESGLPLYCAIDFGIRDATAIIWAQRNPKTAQIRILEAYTKENMPADYFVPLLTGDIPPGWHYSYTADEMEMIARHSQWGKPMIFGDPAGRQRSQSTGQSVLDVFSSHGVMIHTRSDAVDFGTRFSDTQLLMKDMIWDETQAALLDESIRNYRFPENTRNAVRTSEIKKPVHNWASHLASALEYLCVNLPKIQMRERPKPEKRKRAYQYI